MRRAALVSVGLLGLTTLLVACQPPASQPSPPPPKQEQESREPREDTPPPEDAPPAEPSAPPQEKSQPAGRPAPSSPPPSPNIPDESLTRLDVSLAATWEQGARGPELKVVHHIKSHGPVPILYEFRNSGRLCGVIRDAAGEERYRFPQVTAQVMGKVRLMPLKELHFEYSVPASELSHLPPGTYQFEGELCGHDGTRRRAEIKLPPGS